MMLLISYYLHWLKLTHAQIDDWNNLFLKNIEYTA